MGKLDPEALKRPNVAWYQSEEFQERLTKGMAEAKEMALKKQAEIEKAAPPKTADAPIGGA